MIDYIATGIVILIFIIITYYASCKPSQSKRATTSSSITHQKEKVK